MQILGDKLASLGSTPDYMLTIWDWKREKIILRSKAHGQVSSTFLHCHRSDFCHDVTCHRNISQNILSNQLFVRMCSEFHSRLR